MAKDKKDMTRQEWLDGYVWADRNTFLKRVKVEGDDRPWCYTAKRMYKGELHARVVYHEELREGGFIEYKKLVPMDKITFIEE